MVAAGAAMATGGAMGRGARLTVPQARVMPACSVCPRKDVRGSKLNGVARSRNSASTHPGSASLRRGGPRVSPFQRWHRRRPGSLVLSTAGSGSEGNARYGARAPRAARSPSTGGWCSRHPRCWTTSSCMSSVTCASRTTRDSSGSSSSNIARTGVGSATGCGSMDPSSWPSALGSDAAGAAGGHPPVISLRGARSR